jgi:hypothetical protein
MTMAYMKRSLINVVLVLAVILIITGHRLPGLDFEPATASMPATNHSSVEAAEAHEGFIYGRVTTEDGATYEGRLRWGGDEEAFWSDYFNGVRDNNPWADHVSSEQLTERRPIEVFGVKIGEREHQIDLERPVMVRFGDIARIEARGRDLWVTLKSETVFHLDRFGADDFADGLRMWDAKHGIVEFDEWRILSVEFLPTAALDALPDRLHGTVHTGQGEFTGFIQWDREACVGSDELDGLTAEGELGLRFDSIRSIARNSDDSSRVTLHDGREIVLSGTREAGKGNRGVYVNDRRYGRVLVSWDAFQRIDFSEAGSGPAYSDFPTGQPLTGTVTIRGGRRLAGRLVYDLDETETIETLDAPLQGVDYTIPFGLISSIKPTGGNESSLEFTRVALHSGEELQLERGGDLGNRNAGLLIFIDGGEHPEYARWSDVESVYFDRPPAMYPPVADR